MKTEWIRGWSRRTRWTAVFLLLVFAGLGLRVWRRRETPPPPAPVWAPDEDYLSEPDLDFVSPHPATDPAPFPYLAQVVQALNYRLRDVELAGRAGGFRFRHVFQGGCGSGFLRENTVGNDLDYMVTVHLGELETDLADPAAAADALLARMESYLELFHRVVHDEGGPDLALGDGVNMRGARLRDRDRLQQHLADSLAALREGRGRYFFLDTDFGRHVPCHVPQGELGLPNDLMAKLMSNRIQYQPAMYPGIRELGLLFRFYCDFVSPGPDGQAEVKRNVPVNALHSSGRVLGLHNVFIGLAPIGRDSAAFLRAEIAADPAQWVRYRLWVGADLLSQVTRFLNEDNPLKALKRLHQALDFLEPMLDEEAVAGLRPFLRRRLQDPDVLRTDGIRELSWQAADVVASPWLRRLYTGSGDLRRTLRRIFVDLARFEKRCPAALAQEVAGLKAEAEPLLLGDLRSGGDRRLAAVEQVLETLGDSAARWTAALLEPAEGEIAQWRDRLQRELAACGLHPFRAYGIATNETVGLLAEDLAGVVALDALNELAARTNVPPFRYEVIAPDRIPPDSKGRTDYFPLYLWLRPAPGPEAEARFRQALSRLEADLAASGFWGEMP
ncbi:MAG: hypothetical protein KA248_11755 [Kiritimatiellae bacterium]|nr:hypothetical protein [Kiritimatiellia bacterium]